MKHISSIKPTVEKGLYGLVKRPDAKTPDLSELSKTIKKFQDTPDTHFTSALKKRVPSNNSYKLESKDDFGLSKRFKSGSLTKIATPDAAAKLVDSRFSDKSKPFKISQGITGLNKQFEKVLPTKDYSYTDPQYYEYKLKGQTMKDQQLNAFKNQNEDDIDNLDIQGKYKKWREEDLQNKATKIQKVFRGSSLRADLSEGMDGLDEVPEEVIKDAKAKDIIRVGKAERTKKRNAARNEKIALRENIQGRTDDLERLYELEKQAMAERHSINERKKEYDQKMKRNKFIRDSGIEEYAQKGQATKQHKREEKEEKEKRINKGITGLQKVFRGKQIRKNPENSPYDIERIKRFVKPNPDYDPAITDQTDKRSHRELYYKPNILTTTERKAIEYDQSQSRIKKRIEERMEERQRKRQGERLIETKRNLQDKLADFIDQDERPLHQRLSAAYGKKEQKEQKEQRSKENDPRKLAWLKKQDEIDEKTNNEKEEDKQHQQHTTDVENYQTLTGLLENSNSKFTTKEMNNLIPLVYKSFGKNAGTNTRRKVSTVINQLETWQTEKEERQEKIAAHKARLDAKKAKVNKAKQEDSKRRVPPNTRATVHSLDTIDEGKKKENSKYNMSISNENKTNLIPQEYELMKIPETAEGKSKSRSKK